MLSDARRTARECSGWSLLSGDYGQDKLERADTYRVYQDPADILRRLEKVGARSRIDCLR